MKKWHLAEIENAEEVVKFVNDRHLQPGEILIIARNPSHYVVIMYFAEKP